MTHCPPYQDRKTLAANICLGETTIDEYVAAGLLPPARKGKGVPLWCWAEVEAALKGWPFAGRYPQPVADGQGVRAQSAGVDVTERVRRAAARSSGGVA